MPNQVLVFFAHLEEARAFQGLARDLPDVGVLITGIGPRRAGKVLVETLQSQHPSLLVSSGFAGGLDPRLQAGQVVYEACEAPAFAARLEAAGARPARFTGIDHVATTAIAKQTLRQHTGADAVDMESETLREIARTRQIPFAIVRAVSDAANEDLPLDFNRFLEPDGGLRFRHLLGSVLSTPHRLPALMRFHQRSRKAAAHLARVLKAALAPHG